jgi:hypothetical protein
MIHIPLKHKFGNSQMRWLSDDRIVLWQESITSGRSAICVDVVSRTVRRYAHNPRFTFTLGYDRVPVFLGPVIVADGDKNLAGEQIALASNAVIYDCPFAVTFFRQRKNLIPAISMLRAFRTLAALQLSELCTGPRGGLSIRQVNMSPLSVPRGKLAAFYHFQDSESRTGLVTADALGRVYVLRPTDRSYRILRVSVVRMRTSRSRSCTVFEPYTLASTSLAMLSRVGAAVSPLGNRIAFVTSGWDSDLSKDLRYEVTLLATVWSPRGNLIRLNPLAAYEFPVRLVAFSPDGLKLALAGDNDVYVLDVD